MIIMAATERPRTSRGARIRPPSRGGRVVLKDPDSEEENSGRPVSRRDYTPETYQRSDYDVFSRDVGDQRLSVEAVDSSSASSDGEFSSYPSGHMGSPLEHQGHTGSPLEHQGHTGSPIQRQVSPMTFPGSPTPPSQATYRVNSQRPSNSRGNPYSAISPQSSRQRTPQSKHQSQALNVRPNSRQRPSSASKYGRSPKDQPIMHENQESYKDSQSSGSYLANWEDQNKQKNRRNSRDTYYEGGYDTSPRTSYRQEENRSPWQENNNSGYYRPQNSRGGHQDYTMSHDHGGYPENSTGVTHDMRGYQDHSHDRRSSQGQSMSIERKQKTNRTKSARKPPKSSRKVQRDLSPESIIENLPNASMMRPTSSLTRYKLLPAIGTPQAPRREESFLDGLPGKVHKLNLENEESVNNRVHGSGHLDRGDSSQLVTHSRYGFDEGHGQGLESASSSDEEQNNVYSNDRRTSEVFNKEYEDTNSNCDVKHFNRKTSLDNEQHTQNNGGLVSYGYSDIKDFKQYDTSTANRYEDVEDTKRLSESNTEPGEDEERVLLAVRLPNGTRLQRYFRPTDPLKLLVDLAEIKCEISLLEYYLVRNAPRTVFSDLNVIIGDTDLEDRTVLYLDEKD